MANFKDSYRLERVYFEKLKSMISILKSFLDNETDEKTRAILANEIDDNGAILLLYRNLGEAWAELADLIQKLRNDLTDLDEKEEAYHDELNERIDEVNNYLMALIRALEARMDAVEADLAQMGRLFTYNLAETSGVYSLTESGTAVTFADTVSKLTHVRPHFVSVRNGSKYYLIDTYDLTSGTGSVTWSGFEFTPTGEIKETIVTLAADNSVTVTQTSTNFASILSRITTLEECCEDVQEALDGKQDKLTAGENITISESNVISASGGMPTITPTIGAPMEIDEGLYATPITFSNVTPHTFYNQGNYNIPKGIDIEGDNQPILFLGSGSDFLSDDTVNAIKDNYKFYTVPIYFDINDINAGLTIVGSLHYDLSAYGYTASNIFDGKEAQITPNADGTYNLTYSIFYSGLG